MKTVVTLLIFVLPFVAAAKELPGYELHIEVKGLKKGNKCILANYYGGSQFKQDSAYCDEKGAVTFKGTEKMAQGVYIFLPEGKPYFDFIMDAGQHFTLQTDTADYIGNMKVKGSDENAWFYEYQRYMVKMQKQMKPLQDEYQRVKTKKDSGEIVTKKITALDNESKKYRNDFMAAHPQSFVTKLFLLISEPEIPEAPVLPNGRKDSTFAYRYYKAHFFDKIDFSDERMLYTPVFHSKIKQYLEKLTIQSVEPPDSLIASVHLIANKARANPEIFKYLINWMTYTYETSKVMGMEAVFVNIVETYHKKEQTPWIDSTRLHKITDKASNLKFSLLGAPAYPFVMKDTSGRSVALYDVKAKYTVLVIWDYDCGHCKKEIPQLAKLWQDSLKAKGVAVVAVEAEKPAKGWNKFIRENNLNWINVGDDDDYQRAVVKKAYDVYSTPTMYVLDDKKRIRAKRLGVDQLPGFIDHLEKTKVH